MRIRILSVVIIIVLAAGCSSDPKKQIVGKWEAADGDLQALEFEADGKLKVSIKSDPDPVTGTYELVDGKSLKLDIRKAIEDRLQKRVEGRGKLTISVPFWIMSDKAEVTISATELVVKDGEKSKTYKRAK